MLEEIIAKWGNLKLKEAEQLKIKENNYNIDVVMKRGKLSGWLVGNGQGSKQVSYQDHNAELQKDGCTFKKFALI